MKLNPMWNFVLKASHQSKSACSLGSSKHEKFWWQPCTLLGRVLRRVVYGIEGKQNDVSSGVYDEIYTIQGDKMTFLVKVEFPKTVDFDDVDFLKATNFNEHMNMNNYQIKKMCNMVMKIPMSLLLNN